MNETTKTILGRKSVRTYTGEPVAREKIEELVRAGMAAPSAMDQRPWSFVVVTEKEKLEAISAGLKYGKMLPTAAAAIVVCGVPAKMHAKIPAEFWIQDCSAAMENILIAAEGEGLGAVWLGLHPIEEWKGHVREVLTIPKEIEPLGIASLGHPAGSEKPKDKFNSDDIHWNGW
jgi:nitroreductase